MARIERADDPRITEYTALSDAAILRERGAFIAEGRLVVERLLRAGRCRVRSMLLSEAALRAFVERVPDLLEGLDPEVPVFVCPLDAFRQITGFNMHRGCLAIADRPAPLTVPEALAGRRFAVALEGVTNPDNVGGVFRNAAAFAAGPVLLSPTCCDPLYRKAIRTSMAATLQVPFARVAPWPDGLDALRRAGFAIVALTPRQPSLTLETLAAAPPPRVALVLGTEGAGLSREVEAAADVRVRIPISASVDSLNLAVASGIALAALSRARS